MPGSHPVCVCWGGVEAGTKEVLGAISPKGSAICFEF